MIGKEDRKMSLEWLYWWTENENDDEALTNDEAVLRMNVADDPLNATDESNKRYPLTNKMYTTLSAALGVWGRTRTIH